MAKPSKTAQKVLKIQQIPSGKRDLGPSPNPKVKVACTPSKVGK